MTTILRGLLIANCTASTETLPRRYDKCVVKNHQRPQSEMSSFPKCQTFFSQWMRIQSLYTVHVRVCLCVCGHVCVHFSHVSTGLHRPQSSVTLLHQAAFKYSMLVTLSLYVSNSKKGELPKRDTWYRWACLCGFVFGRVACISNTAESSAVKFSWVEYNSFFFFIWTCNMLETQQENTGSNEKSEKLNWALKEFNKTELNAKYCKLNCTFSHLSAEDGGFFVLKCDLWLV